MVRLRGAMAVVACRRLAGRATSSMGADHIQTLAIGVAAARPGWSDCTPVSPSQRAWMAAPPSLPTYKIVRINCVLRATCPYRPSWLATSDYDGAVESGRAGRERNRLGKTGGIRQPAG